MYRLVYYIVVAAVFIVDAKHLPSYIKACKKDDPNLNECAKKHAINAIPSIIKGDKEYKIPVLSPLHIPQIFLQPTPGFSVKLTNVTIKGLETLNIDDIQIDIKKKHNQAIMSFKSVVLEGQYEMDGQILILPIKGTGPAKIVCDNLVIDYSFDYKLVTKDGKEYIDGTNLVPVVSYTVKKVSFKLDNLFNGNKELGDRTNEFLNEHSAEINSEFSSAISETITVIANNILKNIIIPVVPYDELFI